MGNERRGKLEKVRLSLYEVVDEYIKDPNKIGVGI